MPPVPRSRRPRSLTQDEIVDEALRLLRAEGLAGLTMRAVASRLGVTPMAVYYYVDDKEDLLRLVVERITRGRAPLALDGGDWEECLRRHLLTVWEDSAGYPGLSGYLIDQPNLGVTSESLSEGVRFFEAAGFSPATAPLAWSFAMTYIHGRMSVDARLGRRPHAPRTGGLHARDYVLFGIEAVISGLRSMRDGDPSLLGSSVASLAGD